MTPNSRLTHVISSSTTPAKMSPNKNQQLKRRPKQNLLCLIVLLLNFQQRKTTVAHQEVEPLAAEAERGQLINLKDELP